MWQLFSQENHVEDLLRHLCKPIYHPAVVIYFTFRSSSEQTLERRDNTTSNWIDLSGVESLLLEHFDENAGLIL